MDNLLQLSLLCALFALLSLLWLAARAFKKGTLWGFAVLLLSPPAALVFGIRYWKKQKQPLLAYLGTFVAAIGLGLTVFTAWGGWELTRTALRVNEEVRTGTLSDRDAYAYLHASLVFIDNAPLPDRERRKQDLIRRFLNDHETGLSDTQRRQLQDAIGAMLDNGDLGGYRRRELEYLNRQLAKTGPQTAGEPPPPVAAEAVPETGNGHRLLSKRPSTPRAQYRTDYRVIPVSEARHYLGKSFKVTRRNSAEQDCKLIGTTVHSLRFEQRGGGGTFVFEYNKRDIEELKLLTRVES